VTTNDHDRVDGIDDRSAARADGGAGGSSDAGTARDRQPVVVRPFGYVPEEAVIRRVGDCDAYIGNEHAADPAYHDRSFDFVLSATEEPKPSTTHHHSLVDGPGNGWRAFAAAVDDTRTLLERDGSTLVHCRAGVSRSATLLATAIAAEAGRSFRDALDDVQAARPPAMPHPALFENAIVYLAARDEL